MFENVDDAVEAAWIAQRDWATNYKIEDRQRIIEAIRRWPAHMWREWCHKIVEETGMGRYEGQGGKTSGRHQQTPAPNA